MSQTILLAWEMYQGDGDIDYLRRIYDRLDIFTLADFIDETGLINTYDTRRAEKFVAAVNADYLEDIVDWPPLERDGYEMVTHNTVVNAFSHAALVRMGQIAEVLGKSGDAERYRARAESLHTAMLAHLTDPTTGLYVDGKGSTHTAAHALFVPLALGLVPRERVGATLDALRARIAHITAACPPRSMAPNSCSTGCSMPAPTTLRWRLCSTAPIAAGCICSTPMTPPSRTGLGP